MAVTTTPRFGITRWSTGTDPFNRLQMDGSHEAIESKGAIYLQGTAAARPTAGTIGRFYYATDTTAFFYDDGIAWRSVSNPETVLLNAVQTLTNKTLTAPVINGTVTGSSTLTGVNGISTPDFIQFDTTNTEANAVAKMLWNDTDGTFNVGLKGGTVVLQVGQEVLARVRNETGSELPNGKVIYVSGALGDRKLVDLADASDENKADRAIGVLTESIATGQEGFATVIGTVRGLNTNGITVGTALWLSASNPGDLVTTRPVAPNHAIFVGWVTRSDVSDGEIWVHLDGGDHLEYLHDVKFTSLTNKDILTYNSSTELWENTKTLDGVTFTGTTTLPSTTSIGTVSSTEIGYLDGVTSALQTQLNNKQALDADLTAIAALSGTSGILRKDAADTWSLDTVAYAPLASPTFSGTLTLPGTVAGSANITGTLTTTSAGKFVGVGAVSIVTSITRPGTPSEGQIIYETDTDKVLAWDGTAWVPVSGAAAYQADAPSNPNVGSIWIESDATATFINQNDYLTKNEAAIDYATKTELGNAGYSPFLLMGA